MKNRRYIIYLLLIIFLGVADLLLTSSSLIVVPLGGVPAGTLITWLGLVSLPLLLVLSSKMMMIKDQPLYLFYVLWLSMYDKGCHSRYRCRI